MAMRPEDKRPHQPVLGEPQKRRAIMLHKAGLAGKDIARRFGVSPSTISRMLDAEGVTREDGG